MVTTNAGSSEADPMASPLRCYALHIPGLPVPQGSKRTAPWAGKKGGRPILIDDNSGKLKPWREAVHNAAAFLTSAPSFAPLSKSAWRLSCVFCFPRPQGHFGTKGLLPSAPRWHRQKPDLSKLVRAVEDSLTTAGLYLDDCEVCEGQSFKQWATMARPAGAYLVLRELPPPGMVGVPPGAPSWVSELFALATPVWAKH